ncbi:MAG: pantoate--beta-alanine ligase [Actinomycetia bacterium]|nr:pantoate--beta-alanine ligase [Actinomycetes bacterium]
MRVAHSRAELAETIARLPGALALAPTMGALHDGHLALIAAARRSADSVLVTVFVNPLQFGPTEDLAAYPRSLDADLAACARAGADAVWAPAVADVYPDGEPTVRVDPGPLGSELEGSSRPGHFSGALTVVARLCNLIRPALAVFGEKDYQQLVLIRRMAADLELGVAVAGVPTVREPDGLALSSRNVYLSADDRVRARSLARALRAGRAAAPGGAAAVLAAAAAELAGLDVDYLELRDPELGPPPRRGPARLLVAARVGRARLIDNTEVTLAP